MQTQAAMELPEARIRAQYPLALSWLERVEHAPRLGRGTPAPLPEGSPGVPRARFRSTTPGLAGRSAAPPGEVRLKDRIEAVGGDDLASPAAATVLRDLRRALAIALALGEELSGRTGAAELKRANLEGRLAPERRAEFAELLAVESLALLSVFANATAFLLADQAGPETVDIGAVEEILTDNPFTALQGALWEMDQKIAAHASDDRTLVATVLAFAEALSAAVRARAEALPRAGLFGEASWRVEADDLPIAGFAPPTRGRGKPLAMTFKRPEEVVGNAVAKHQAMRLAKMIVAYDFDRRMNPFVELGGFIFTFLGDGRPGTGKTTLIQMMAGLIDGYCRVAGYPFVYRNLGIDNVDSYQGKSGQNARAFVEAVIDPAVIGFGTIDDIDQVAGRRGDRQSSSGQQEITAVLMDAFSGAGTVVRGNATFGMFSNHAESIDDALRQRAGARFLIDGPKTREDYIDIFALLLGKRHDIPVGAHDLMKAQAIKAAVREGYQGHDRPHEAGLAKVWEGVEARLGPLDTLADFGAYLHAIAEAEPRFTGRAVKNITDAVKLRTMDFDLPDAWFETPEPFLHQPYDRKLAMIADLRQPITPQMVVQEINRYADSEWRYAETSDEAAIAEAVRGMERMAEARRRFEEGAR